MEYYVKSVVPIIKMNYDRFTTVEKSIADFFIENREKVDLSSKAMADRLYVSEASLSRFAQKCGYRGYREFVYQYESTFVENRESMTAGEPEPFRAYCTEVIRMPSLQYHNQGNVISPQFPILLTLDILYSYYAAQDKGAKELLHDDTLRALDGGKAQHRIKGGTK